MGLYFVVFNPEGGSSFSLRHPRQSLRGSVDLGIRAQGGRRRLRRLWAEQAKIPPLRPTENMLSFWLKKKSKLVFTSAHTSFL